MPSPPNIQDAAYPQALNLIVSLAQKDRPDLRAFCIRREEVEEVTLIEQP